MRGFCLNCFRNNVELNWKGLCYSCSLEGADLGTRFDGMVLLCIHLWGLIFFTTLIPRSVIELTSSFFNSSVRFWGMMLSSFVLYLIFFVIPLRILKRRYYLLYFLASLYMFILLPLKRMYYWFFVFGEISLFNI